MGCCGGSNKQGNKKIKEWGNEKSQNKISLKQNLKTISVLLFLGFIIYKFIIF